MQRRLVARISAAVLGAAVVVDPAVAADPPEDGTVYDAFVTGFQDMLQAIDRAPYTLDEAAVPNVLPELDEREGLALSAVLEVGDPGGSLDWRNPTTGMQGTITAVGERTVTRGRVCRDYRRRVSIDTMVKNYAGTACRIAPNVWSARRELEVPVEQPIAMIDPPNEGEIADLQADLNRLGYDVGATDGVAGARTIAAVRLFQRDAGLPENGRIDDQLLAAVRAKAVDHRRIDAVPIPPPKARERQAEATLTASDPPPGTFAIRGVWLGQPMDQVLLLFPSMEVVRKPRGDARRDTSRAAVVGAATYLASLNVEKANGARQSLRVEATPEGHVFQVLLIEVRPDGACAEIYEKSVRIYGAARGAMRRDRVEGYYWLSGQRDKTAYDVPPFRRLLAIKCTPEERAIEVVTSLVDFDVRERFYPAMTGATKVRGMGNEARPNE